VKDYTDQLRTRAEAVNEASLGLLQALEQTSNSWTSSLSALLALDDATAIKDGLASALQHLPPPNASTNLASAIVGLSEVRILKYQADLIDLLWGSGNLHRRRPSDQRSELMGAMNIAAAKGDWDEWQRLVDEYYGLIARGNERGGTDSGGGDGEGSGD
jgi:hypothetical protein